MDEKSKRERWPGGYVHRQRDGRPLFILERKVGKKRYHFSTRCHSLRAAMRQLEIFESNPAGYTPGGHEPEDPLYLTAELLEEYWTWMTEEKGNTRRHANQMHNRLADWIEDLPGVDLRHLTLRDHISPALARRKTCRPARIIALKAFMGWLRKVKHLLTHAQDPTLDLPVPQAVPEKWKRRKVLDRARALAAISKLSGAERDCLELRLATGWHQTELERFVRSPESEIATPAQPVPGVLAVLITRHKGGELTRTPLSHPEQLEAAKRMRARGKIPRKLNEALAMACRAAEVEPFGLGVLRHSVGTWAVEDGASPPQVSEFLGHKDPRTTRRFYLDVAVPTTTVPVLRLVKG